MPSPMTFEHQSQKRPEALDSWHSSGTILVVDDEPMVRFVMRTVLAATGFTVLEAEDGAQGLEVFRQHDDEIRAVLLDLSMPRMDGEEAFTEMRRLNAQVPIVILSGYNEQDSMERFPAEALASFLPKPFKPVALVEKMREVLEG